jgi:hypothetical protein
MRWEAKATGKKYLVTLEYDETQIISDTVELEVFARDKDHAEQIAVNQFYEEFDEDTCEIQNTIIDELEAEEEKDDKTLDLFTCDPEKN